MPRYYRSNMARAGGLVMGSIAIYAAVVTDDNLFRGLWAYAALDSMLGIVTGEYGPISSRIFHALRIIG